MNTLDKSFHFYFLVLPASLHWLYKKVQMYNNNNIIIIIIIIGVR
jgi:hypothetical protein